MISRCMAQTKTHITVLNFRDLQASQKHNSLLNTLHSYNSNIHLILLPTQASIRLKAGSCISFFISHCWSLAGPMSLHHQCLKPHNAGYTGAKCHARHPSPKCCALGFRSKCSSSHPDPRFPATHFHHGWPTRHLRLRQRMNDPSPGRKDSQAIGNIVDIVSNSFGAMDLGCCGV